MQWGCYNVTSMGYQHLKDTHTEPSGINLYKGLALEMPWHVIMSLGCITGKPIVINRNRPIHLEGELTSSSCARSPRTRPKHLEPVNPQSQCLAMNPNKNSNDTEGLDFPQYRTGIQIDLQKLHQQVDKVIYVDSSSISLTPTTPLSSPSRTCAWDHHRHQARVSAERHIFPHGPSLTWRPNIPPILKNLTDTKTWI